MHFWMWLFVFRLIFAFVLLRTLSHDIQGSEKESAIQCQQPFIPTPPPLTVLSCLSAYQDPGRPDTLIRVTQYCLYVCLLLIPPRGAKCGAECLKPLSIPCMEEGDKTNNKLPLRLQSEKEAIITGGIWVPFAQESKTFRLLNVTHESLVQVCWCSHWHYVHVCVNCMKAVYFCPAGFDAAESWWKQLPSDGVSVGGRGTG